ncbi:protein phosphatase 1 regulatory subunit 36 isoform X1 [Ptiloglossa arizonensis]|uniref:protein phosphatase 1 regulatory subunit 36 isoform X1 n=1 Tax=Ptiloglossa arizonensis TaxID=3350558 RepID=UPI003F9F26E4
MEDKHFVWDDITDGLHLFGVQNSEAEHVKRHEQQSDSVHGSKVYCLHAFLILNFHETLSQREKIRFRRQYLRKISPNEPNVIILQDIKDLVMFLLATPISPQFVNLFHLPAMDRFLRAVIIYFQYYVTIWEELMEKRAATMKKAPNPLAKSYRSRFADNLQNLRCVLGREYADLIVGCQDSIQYHHMSGGKKGTISIIQSQGEKGLRMFEVLICMAHRVVWIALQRKYFTLIEIELHRLFRTDSYNIAERRSSSQIMQDILTDDIKILYGHKLQEKRKLLRNSPLIEELIFSNCDYRLLSLGMGGDSSDERILYLQNALLIEEDKLHELGIRVGILGDNKAHYDLMLIPVEDEKLDKIQLSDGRIYEKRSTKVISDSDKRMKVRSLPLFQSEFKMALDFPIKINNVSPNTYQTVHEEARKRWLIREIKRQKNKNTDTYSISTMLN